MDSASSKPATETYNSDNGLTYTLVGDYYLPNLIIESNSNYAPGIWAIKRLAYLREHKRVLYTNLITTGRLDAHLQEVDELAAVWAHRLPIEMVKREGVDESLKHRDPMRWVGPIGRF